MILKEGRYVGKEFDAITDGVEKGKITEEVNPGYLSIYQLFSVTLTENKQKYNCAGWLQLGGKAYAEVTLKN